MPRRIVYTSGIGKTANKKHPIYRVLNCVLCKICRYLSDAEVFENVIHILIASAGKVDEH